MMIFCNIGWMDKYEGLKSGDKIRGGGKFVSKHGFGWEVYNFQPLSGRMYGYVQPTGKIHIERLGAPKDSNKIDHILVIWTARDYSHGGVFIVGWYRDATVYRNYQPVPKGSNRKTPDKKEAGFFVEAKEKDCKLLPKDKRTFHIPKGKNGMGQSNVWYADKRENFRFREQVLGYVKEGKNPSIAVKRRIVQGKAWQPDPFKREKVEKIAIKEATEYYKKAGYIVDSKEKDNLGWDLEASLGNKTLKLEVKGLSGNDIVIDLTPKEYEKMKEYKKDYRICVVIDCLNVPLLRSFFFSRESEEWEDDEGNVLKITEITGARAVV
ncbi:MAG: DUF3883 domain-containing protein [Candidatus Omnitrophota bacterium]|nr:DUF3883 domain-containing protein [Candidatus Omnitrophota bacterium]